MQKIQRPKNLSSPEEHPKRRRIFRRRKIRDAKGWVPNAPKEYFSEGGLRTLYGTPKNEGKFPNRLIYPLYLILDFSQKQVG